MKQAIIIFLFLVEICAAQSDELSYSFSLNTNNSSIQVIMTYESQSSINGKRFILPSNYDRTTLKSTLLIERLDFNTPGKFETKGLDTLIYTGNEKQISLSYLIPTFSETPYYLSCEDDNYFIPKITPDFFHFYGDKALILPELDINKSQSYNLSIQWINFPETWHLANDFGMTQINGKTIWEQNTSELELNFVGENLFFGGTYRKYEFSYKNKNFHTYFYDDFNLDEDKLLLQLQNVIKTSMDFWDHFHHSKDYVISITQKGMDCGKLNGRNMYNSFAFYLPQNFDNKYLPIIFGKALTHEFTHSWLGSNLIGNNPKWEEMRWFVEGFTEYYAMKINLMANVITQKQFIDLLNSSINKYYLSPYREITLKEYISGSKLSSKLEKSAYDKGAVFALYLDGYLRNKSNNKHNLDNTLKVILKTAPQKIKGNLDLEQFAELFKELTEVEISDLIETYIIKGKTVPAVSPLISSSEDRLLTSFEYGFSFIKSIDKSVVKDLNKDSNAYKKGLRDGQKILSVQSIANRPDDNIILEIEQNGISKLIKFKPQGEKIYVPLIKEYQFNK